MYLKKAQAGSAPGHTWDEDGQVIEVDDHLAAQLLSIPAGGFSEAEPPAEPPAPDAQEPEDDTPKKKGGRPPLPRDEDGNIIRKTEIAE